METDFLNKLKKEQEENSAAAKTLEQSQDTTAKPNEQEEAAKAAEAQAAVQKTEAELEAEKQLEQEKSNEFIVKSPFEKTEVATEKTKEQYEKEISDLAAERDEYYKMLQDPDVLLLLDAKEKGKNIYDIIEETKPINVDALSLEQLFDMQAAERLKSGKWNDKDIEEEREAFEAMTKGGKENYVLAFAEKLKRENEGKKPVFDFNPQERAEQTLNFKKEVEKVNKENAAFVENEMSRLVKEGFISDAEVNDFKSKIASVKNPFEITEQGVLKPDMSVLIELVYWREKFQKTVNKAIEETEKRVRLEEAENRRNTNPNAVTTTYTPSNSKNDDDAWKEAVKKRNS